MRRFVVGDIHGAHKALRQCFESAKFDRQHDWLVSLGDVCDGWPEVRQVLDELLSVKNFRLVLGNHDAWALRWMQSEWSEEEWVSQGGAATLESYGRDRACVPESHLKLLKNAPYFFEMNNKLFVHGGFDPSLDIHKQDPESLLWDRNLLSEAARTSEINPDHRYGKWEEIFVGHTPTQHYRSAKPIHACNVWGLDTGAGWSGRLTLMDIDTHDYWQSDFTPSLYPGVPGRH